MAPLTGVSLLPVSFALAALLTGCSSPSAESTAALAMQADFLKLETSIERELDRLLKQEGLPRWSEADRAAEEKRYRFVAAGWKATGPAAPGAEPLTRSVILFVDVGNRQLAVFVEVRDARGLTEPGAQQALEKLVGDSIALERLRFEREAPGAVVGEVRDHIPAASR